MKKNIIIIALIIAIFLGMYQKSFAVYQQINFGCSTNSGTCSESYNFNLNSGDTFSVVENIVIEIEGDFNGSNENINIDINGQQSGFVNTGQQGGGFYSIDTSFINTALLIGASSISISATSTSEVDNGFTSNGNTWNIRISFDYQLSNGGSSGSGSTGDVIVNIDNGEGINKEVFDMDTYVAIMEIEGIAMVLIIFFKFWHRILSINSKRKRNIIF